MADRLDISLSLHQGLGIGTLMQVLEAIFATERDEHGAADRECLHSPPAPVAASQQSESESEAELRAHQPLLTPVKLATLRVWMLKTLAKALAADDSQRAAA